MTVHRNSDRRSAPPSRREVLAMGARLAAGLASAAMLPAGHAFAQVPARTHQLTLGDAQITILSDGNMTLPVSMVLPETPQADIATAYAGRPLPTAGISAEVNVVVIRKGKDLIVVDSGGTSDFMPTLGLFADRLEKAGIKADDVTHVVFTHAHADHLWGVIDPLDDDTRFQKAKHFMSAEEMNFWRQPDVDTKVPDAQKGMAIGTARRLKMLEMRLEVARPGSEIVPGVQVLATPGHTPGHVSIAVQGGTSTLVIGGDALANAVVSFERPDWPWGPDLMRETAAATRKKLLDQLAADRMQLVGYHLPWPGVGRVERRGSAYRFNQS